jgi:hypothetical protein
MKLIFSFSLSNSSKPEIASEIERVSFIVVTSKVLFIIIESEFVLNVLISGNSISVIFIVTKKLVLFSFYLEFILIGLD